MGTGMGLKGLLLLWPDPQGPQHWARVPRYVPDTGVSQHLLHTQNRNFWLSRKDYRL